MKHNYALVEAEIKSLLVRERYYRDSKQWDKLRDSYHPDATKTSINITWYALPTLDQIPFDTIGITLSHFPHMSWFCNAENLKGTTAT
mgnify:CR=1 FL=1